MKEKISVTPANKDIFQDLGLPDAPELRLKSDLMIRISEIIEDRNLTQAQAAAILGIDQPKVSALRRGHMEKFSVDRLYDFLRKLGCDIEIRIIMERKKVPGRFKLSMAPRKTTAGLRRNVA